jgi:hypothetical protein
MTRRGFFRGLAAAAVLAATPLPALAALAVREHVERNRLLSATQIINEALRVLHANSSFLPIVNRAYDPAFAQRGDVVRVRLPARYGIR